MKSLRSEGLTVSMKEKGDVIVVGGGVVGVCVAYYLAKTGMTVVLVEKGEICSGCSYANAGLITPSHSLPIPAPGVIKQACKWLLQEDSPLLFRLRLDWRLAYWLVRFAAACREQPMNRAIPVLRDLSRGSLDLFEELILAEGLSFDYERLGLLCAYTTHSGYEKGKRDAELLTHHGFAPRVLDGKHARELEPNLGTSVIGTVYFEDDAHGNGYDFVTQMSTAAKRLGVKIHTNTAVAGLLIEDSNHICVKTEGGDLLGRNIVITAGAWTSQFTKILGVEIPVEPGKGYSVTIDRPDLSPKIPVLNMEKKVAVTPIGKRLRFAGTMEFSGLDLTLNERRADAVLRGGLEVISRIASPQNVERWCGLRPCTPDGLPIIGRMPGYPHVYIATGHAMLGFTLGPITGKLIGEMISGGHPSFDTAMLRVERF